ncbi:hypothetical protein Acid7E03_34580 [Acidisoma sp. 7E03]
MLQRLARASGRGDENQIRRKAEAQDRTAHRGGIRLTLCIERTVVIGEAGVVPARFGMAKEQQVTHGAILA